jgi:hypothetical protein
MTRTNRPPLPYSGLEADAFSRYARSILAHRRGLNAWVKAKYNRRVRRAWMKMENQ